MPEHQSRCTDARTHSVKLLIKACCEPDAAAASSVVATLLLTGVLLNTAVDSTFGASTPSRLIGLFPLLAATMGGHVVVVTSLLDAGANPNQCREIDRVCSLHLAVAMNKLTIVSLLLDSHADVEQRNGDGASALNIAANEPPDSPDLVQLLLDRGASVSQPDAQGRTPLHSASAQGFPNKVSALIDGGADVNWPSQTGAGPLYVAAQNGHVNVVRQLLLQSANVDQQNLLGSTACHVAAGNGHIEVVKALLEAGANRTIRDENGLSARDGAMAMWSRQDPSDRRGEIVSLLGEEGV